MSRAPLRDWRAARAIARSELFDSDWYRKAYPDVAEWGVNPIHHYIAFGAAEGRDPGPSFSTRAYLECNQDVAVAGVNPLGHYLLHGLSEGRSLARSTVLLSPYDNWGVPAPRVAVPAAASIAGLPNDAVTARFPRLRPLPTYQVPGDITLRVTMVTDSINAGSLYGGVATAIILSTLLARKLDARLRIVTLTEPPVRDNVAMILACHGIDWTDNIEFEKVDIPYTGRPCNISPNDVFVTTSWWSTVNVKNATRSNRIVYLLQEDERMFYPSGDEQLRCHEMIADQSIDFVVNSQLLYNHLVYQGFSNLIKRGMWFEPAFPIESYFCEPVPRNRNNFIFYARPNNVRNLYYRGIEAINAALRDDIFDLASWQFTFIGRDLNEVLLDRNIKPRLLQNVPWNEYAALIRKSDLGLSLMYTPHPSYPPLDLAASGAVAVTNRFGQKNTLDNYSQNIICADCDVESLVEGLRLGVKLSCDKQKRIQNFERSNIQRRWDVTLGPIIDKLARIN